MNTDESIKPQEERRRTVKYGNNDVPNEFVNDVLRCGSIYSTLSGAERNKTDKKTNAAIPSDAAVDEMREWSSINKL